MAYIAAIDEGTTGTRAVLYDLDNKTVLPEAFLRRGERERNLRGNARLARRGFRGRGRDRQGRRDRHNEPTRNDYRVG